MTQRSRKVSVQGVIGSVLALGVAGGTVAFAALGPDPASLPTTQPVEVSSEPGSITLVCPAALQLPSGDGADPEFDPAPEAARTWFQAQLINGPGHVAVEGETGEPRWVQQWNPSGTSTSELTWEPDPANSGPRAGAASIVAAVPAGDLTGIAAGVCDPPSFDKWLTGLSTVLGTSTRLVVHNPGDSPLTVTVNAWGATGPIVSDDSVRLQVPPGSSQFTLVEGLFPDQRRLALRLTSSGGPFHAAIQHNELHGLEPAGMDYITAGSSPSSSFSIPGIRLDETVLDSDSTPSRVQFLNPGEEDRSVELALLGTDGPVTVPGWETNVSLPAGTVTDVSLAGLPAGDYSVVGTADGDVVVTATVVRGAESATLENPQDSAWIANASPLAAGEQSVVAVPEDVDGYVAITPVAQDDTIQGTLTLWGRDGRLLRTESISGDPGAVQILPLQDFADQLDEPISAISVTSESSMQWAVGIEGLGWAETGDHAFAVLTPTALTERGQVVTVQQIP